MKKQANVVAVNAEVDQLSWLLARFVEEINSLRQSNKMLAKENEVLSLENLDMYGDIKVAHKRLCSLGSEVQELAKWCEIFANIFYDPEKK